MNLTTFSCCCTKGV